MPEDIKTLYLYLAEGIDTNGDPVRALVTGRDPSHARRKVREAYQGVIRNLRLERITGNQWYDYLKGYGTKYGPIEPYREDYAFEAADLGIGQGQPIFL